MRIQIRIDKLDSVSIFGFCYNNLALKTQEPNMEKTKSKPFLPLGASLNNTYYYDSAERPSLCNQEIGQSAYDVAIIGAGFTGIGAALRLAKAGLKVAVFEQSELGAGASGRNGGLICTGYRQDQKWLEEKVGKIAATQMWEIAEAAKSHLSALVKEHKIEADIKYGFINAAHKTSMMHHLEDDANHLARHYNYDKMSILNMAETADTLGTNAYKGGQLDMGAGRLHPLKLLYGMAKAANDFGAQIIENCRIEQIKETNGKVLLRSKFGEFTADKIIICGDGYLHGIDKTIEAIVMPIYSFVIATEKLNDNKIMKSVPACADTRFVLNYFQKTADNRLIFGGGEKYDASWPKDVKAFVANNLYKIFPQLKSTNITHAWGGALGITPTRLPMVSNQSDKILVAGGYSGQGVLLAPFFGNILGEYILGDGNRFNIINKLPTMPFPGGRLMRFPLLSAAMSYYSILDKLP